MLLVPSLSGGVVATRQGGTAPGNTTFYLVINLTTAKLVGLEIRSRRRLGTKRTFSQLTSMADPVAALMKMLTWAD